MKTKTKKPVKKSTAAVRRPGKSIPGRHFGVGLGVLVVIIVAVSYQIVRANNDSGLPLSAPNGSLAREAQLDSAEMQKQSQTEADYEAQQTLNAQSDAAMSNLVEVTNDAAR